MLQTKNMPAKEYRESVQRYVCGKTKLVAKVRAISFWTSEVKLKVVNSRTSSTNTKHKTMLLCNQQNNTKCKQTLLAVTIDTIFS